MKTKGVEEERDGDMKSKYKFVIVSPEQYVGGAIAMHALCKYLQEDGYDAAMMYVSSMEYRKGKHHRFWIHYILDNFEDIRKRTCIRLFGENRYLKNPKYIGYVNESVKGCKRKRTPFVDKKTIVIYPDVVYGNFLHAKNVVRWLMYFNRFGTDPAAYGKNDMFVSYRKLFNDPRVNPQERLLTVSYFDLDLYKRVNYGPRKGKCYIIRKGKKRVDLPQHFDGVVVDDLPEAEKVKAFNECEYCISYDMQTAYSSIAAMCGCISVIVPEDGKTIDDYRTEDDSCNGVAFGFQESEIKRAIATAPCVLEDYQNELVKSRENARKFVAMCELYFDDSN